YGSIFSISMMFPSTPAHLPGDASSHGVCVGCEGGCTSGISNTRTSLDHRGPVRGLRRVQAAQIRQRLGLLHVHPVGQLLEGDAFAPLFRAHVLHALSDGFM